MGNTERKSEWRNTEIELRSAERSVLNSQLSEVAVHGAEAAVYGTSGCRRMGEQVAAGK